jgi:hypothetical protein
MAAAAISAAFSFETPQDVLVGVPSKRDEQRQPAASHESAALPTCGLSLRIAPSTRAPRAPEGRVTMSLGNTDHACPVCGRPIRLLTTIRRVPGEQTLVPQCRPCDLSTTETVDAPKPGESMLTLRHPGDPGMARPSLDHEHGRLHGAGAEPIQGLLEGLSGGWTARNVGTCEPRPLSRPGPSEATGVRRRLGRCATSSTSFGSH